MIIPHRGRWPRIHETAFLAPSCDVVGEVEIGAESSVWFQVVVRGDVNTIKIGSRTNVQDLSCLHVTREKHPLTIGDEVTIGHRVMLHGCTIGNRVLLGMGSIVLDGAVIEDECWIAAGALVTQGARVPRHSMVMGVPGKVVRPLKPEEIAFLKKSADNYVSDAREYRGYVLGPKRLGANHEDLESTEEFEEGELGDLEERGGKPK